ncbi:MAG: exodeoxyribonuclease V subunit alpha [Deltaproteobacteria bacterium]|nr:MAG: exodeoxyribonuclease V subunit alpha [Deltaproteobacteria bacterium]
MTDGSKYHLIFNHIINGDHGAMTNFNFDPGQLLQNLETFKIFESKGQSEAKMLLPFISHMELSFLDYMTIRDLMELGGYQGDTALAIVLMIMFAVLQEGSLCLDLDKNKLMNRLPADTRKKTGKIIGDFLSGLSEGKYQKLITRNGDKYMPFILDTSGERQLLYFQKYYIHENRLKNRMEAFLKAKVSFNIPDQKIDNLLKKIYSPPLAIRVSQDNTPIIKDSQQVKAIRLALKSQFSIISGGPGTGKTSLMVNILRCLVRAGIPISRIIFGAPTGRAAQRITETIQNSIAGIQEPASEDLDLLNLKGSTLHKILRYRSYAHDFYYQHSNPLPVSVVLIDEVSMVDVVMLDKFLQAVDPVKTKLVFLGDKDQLPSVEAGSVFEEMIPNEIRASRFKNRFVVLQKVYRSGVNLLELANQTNTGDFPPFTAVTFETALSIQSDQWAFVTAESFDNWRKHIYQWVRYQYLNPLTSNEKSFKDLLVKVGEMTAGQIMSSEQGQDLLRHIFMVVERARILSFLRSGIYGCTVINTLIFNYLINEFDPLAKRQSHVFSGALIIITRNDYSKELFNGDVGVMIKDGTGTYRAFFHRSGSYISFPVNLLPSWEFAFATTVHKSQGSEFDDVLLVLPDNENHRLLTRQIVYTGITRAKKRVVIYGSQAALNAALQKKIERQSGLMW